MKVLKLDPPDETTFDFEGVHFWTLFWELFDLYGGQNWTLKMLNPVPPGGAVLRSPQNLLKSRYPSPDLHQMTQTGTCPKKLSLLSPKTNPLKNPLAPAYINHFHSIIYFLTHSLLSTHQVHYHTHSLTTHHVHRHTHSSTTHHITHSHTHIIHFITHSLIQYLPHTGRSMGWSPLMLCNS